MGLKKVGFFCESHHWPIVRPVWDLAQSRFDCFVSPWKEEIIEFNPHALIVARACPKSIRKNIPKTYVIWLRHGFSDKNYAELSLKRTDFACVSSDWAIDDFTAKGYKPHLGYWMTGFSAMDQVYHRIAAAKNPQKKGRDINILYAPTYNPELSAQSQLGEGWIEAFAAMSKNTRLLVKPHPLTPEYSPEHILYYKKMADSFKCVEMLNPASDFYEVMEKGDIVISDASSVIFFYLALNRPIILVDNQKRFECGKYNANGPEWQWRDMGDRVKTPRELLAAIQEAVDSPQKNSELRMHYRKKVLGNTFDGKACERIVSHLKQLLSPSPPQAVINRKMRYKKKIWAFGHKKFFSFNRLIRLWLERSNRAKLNE